MEKLKKIRLGIIGTGRIAHRFVPEVRLFENIQVAAVCNPNISSAKKFAEEFDIPVYVETAQKLLEYVDAVYIATPHQTHYGYVKEMLLAGKHVLCEKPMVFNKNQAEDLFSIAKKKNLVLMEGIKTAYCPGFQALLEVVKSGKIGEVYDVEACFTKLTPNNLREMTDIEYGGSFLELGTYSMLPIMKILGTEEEKVIYHKAIAENGVDIYTKAYFDYGNKTGLAKTGLGVKSEGQLIIAGTEGYILVQAPWWLTKHFEVRYEDPNKKDIYDIPFEGQGLRYEIKAFVEMIESRERVSQAIKPEDSIWLAEKMEQFFKIDGQRYIEKG